SETILSTSTGDSERWLISPSAAGPGGRTPLVVVKPTACDLSTNLVIATDRRVYELALDSPPCRGADSGEASYNPHLPYTGLVRFYYPDELVKRWAEADQAAQRDAQAREASRTPLAPTARLASLNFNYTWPNDRHLPWTPAQVFDDGEHTYVVLPPGARFSEAPVLFGLQSDGSLLLLNFRLERGTYVTDRVVDRAVLAAGSGKTAERIEIVNRARGRK
ncbi:MAG: TrbG/VirB9 family P-type conjugative transfer protein, partial [Acidobacteriota bacterium]|nr:TrbG/VirB9 family P-type conjugative transfer protein [Acidobacteriota bacterium]